MIRTDFLRPTLPQSRKKFFNEMEIGAHDSPRETDVVSIEGIKEAAARIGRHVHCTPVMTCRALDEMSGGREVFFKCELFQKTGSFKARGACNAVLLTPPECRDIVTHSSGNHAQVIQNFKRLENVDPVSIDVGQGVTY